MKPSESRHSVRTYSFSAWNSENVIMVDVECFSTVNFWTDISSIKLIPLCLCIECLRILWEFKLVLSFRKINIRNIYFPFILHTRPIPFFNVYSWNGFSSTFYYNGTSIMYYPMATTLNKEKMLVRGFFPLPNFNIVDINKFAFHAQNKFREKVSFSTFFSILKKFSFQSEHCYLSVSVVRVWESVKYYINYQIKLHWYTWHIRGHSQITQAESCDFLTSFPLARFSKIPSPYQKCARNFQRKKYYFDFNIEGRVWLIILRKTNSLTARGCFEGRGWV